MILLFYFAGVIFSYILLKFTNIPDGQQYKHILGRIIYSLLSWALIVLFVCVYICYLPIWNKKAPKWL